MSEPTPKTHYPKCPFCGSNDAYRTGRKGLIEWFLHHILIHSPYRCNDCYERFFHHRSAHHSKDQLHHHPA